jgi:cystathionine beta-lyase
MISSDCDFDAIINRKNTNSSKWDFFQKHLSINNIQAPIDTIPMWVADMDFLCAPEITQALKKIVTNGVYGYSELPTDFSSIITAWLYEQHNFDIPDNYLVYTTSAITGLYFVLREFTKVGDTILFCQPTYPPITQVINNLNRTPLIHNLYKNPTNEKYIINYELLDKNLAQAKMFVFCNPHNPTGTNWSLEDLEKIVKLCQKHKVPIFSDDVHADIVYPPHKYISLYNVAKKIVSDFASNIITLFSANKIFNIAGMKTATIIIPNEKQRKHIIHQQKICFGANIHSPFSIAAMQAAYGKGSSWKQALISYLLSNRNFLLSYLSKKIPEVMVTKPTATYLAWLDFTNYLHKKKMLYFVLQKKLLEDAKVGLSAGLLFGKEGENHMRLNFACPKIVLKEALDRISYVL